MGERARPFLWISWGMVLLLILALFLYFSLAQSTKDTAYVHELAGGMVNPVLTLSDAEATLQFDSSYVKYLLYAIGAHRLHAPPLSSDDPRLAVVLDGVNYSAYVHQGAITVSLDPVMNPDVIIYTTRAELVMMLRDETYVQTAFRSGSARIVLVASKTTLFGKGYLQLYTALTGKSITGNVIRIVAG